VSRAALRTLDLHHGRAGPLGPYEIGLALEPGEVLFRQVWARYWTLGTTTEMVDGYGRVRVVPPRMAGLGMVPSRNNLPPLGHSAFS
jgi:hypothetical protein